jgi:glycosyltransferase involved in cell wall biosynthesis
MKTRVLVLDQHCYWGGGQRVLKTVLDSLRDQVDALVALPERGPLGADLEREGIETCAYPLGKYRSGAKSAADMAMFGPRSVYAALQLAAIVSQRKLELIYINGPRCLLAGVLAARLTGRPSLFCLHQTLGRAPEIALVSRLAKHVSRIIACSQAAADSLLRAQPALATKLRVLYPPVNDLILARPVSIAYSTSKSPVLRVGMVGRITQAKGHHVLLAALASLQGSARAVFVGAPAPGSRQDASYVRTLQSMTRDNGLDVEWAGYHADPKPYYSVMDVLAVASIGEEGMPLVALEALQRGVPVIASRLGGLPELVQDGINGLLIPPNDPKALACALERLAGDPALLRQLGARAHSTIDERFSKPLYCGAIAGTIAELCQSPSPLQVAAAWRES